MPDRGAHSYPPVGDPDRLDAIVQRGRSLRQRRQFGAAGVGAGGALLVALVAVVVFSGSSGSNEQLLADDGTTTTSPTTTTTVTTVPPPPEMTVELVQGPPAQIVVNDPEQPAGEGTQQCLTVAVHSPDRSPDDGGIAIAEGTVCAPGLSEGGIADLALVPSTSSEAGADPGAEVGTDLGTGSTGTGGPTEINCAASVVRPAPEAIASTETRPGITTFTLSAPDLPPGPYRVSVDAVSGIGDGCAPEQPEGELENVAQFSGILTLP